MKITPAYTAPILSSTQSKVNVETYEQSVDRYNEGKHLEALHLLLPPPKPRLNDVLCRVQLTEKDWLLLPQVMEEIAAPGLCGTFSTRTPILIDRIEPEMLACPAFCNALMQVQAREQLAIFVVADGAEKPLQQMMPENRQRWFSAPDTRAETLVEAAMLRL